MEALALRLWSNDDLPLLRRGNTPEMTAHLNGPETEEQVRQRHERYLRLCASGEARTFVILAGDEPVGSIAYWKTDWHDQPALEAGWFVVPEAQGQGVASRALALVIEDARAHRGERQMLTACPAVENLASNGVCRRNGFTLHGTFTASFRGGDLTHNDWALDLTAA
ncbi:MAG: GNAT family N-acetyltransferase [Microbacterium sp.]